MRRGARTFPALATLALAAMLPSPATGDGGFGLVDVVIEWTAPDQLIVAAEVLGLEPAAVSVELQVERSGAAGTVVSRQTQALDMEAGKRARAATVAVNFAPGDRIAGTAILRHGDIVLSIATLSAGQAPDATGPGGLN